MVHFEESAAESPQKKSSWLMQAWMIGEGRVIGSGGCSTPAFTEYPKFIVSVSRNASHSANSDGRDLCPETQ